MQRRRPAFSRGITMALGAAAFEEALQRAACRTPGEPVADVIPKRGASLATIQALSDPGQGRIIGAEGAGEQQPLEGPELEAALRLPRMLARRDLARMLQADLDRELAVAIGFALGMQIVPLPSDVAPALEGHEFEVVGADDQLGEVYILDGKPILWVGDPELQDDGENVSVKRPIRHLQAGVAATQPETSAASV